MLTRDKNILRNNFISHTIGVKGIEKAEYQLPSGYWLSGARIGLSGHIEGESFDFQVHHHLYGHLTEYDFGTNINVDPESWQQIVKSEEYWAEMQSGLTVVVNYNKSESNTNEVMVYADLFFHKPKEG